MPYARSWEEQGLTPREVLRRMGANAPSSGCPVTPGCGRQAAERPNSCLRKLRSGYSAASLIPTWQPMPTTSVQSASAERPGVSLRELLARCSDSG